MPATLKTRSIKGLVWSLGENAGVAFLSLFSFIVMARLLDPVDFGLAALASVFIICFNLLIGGGLADALVQRASLTASHIQTAFWSTLGLSAALSALCIFAAPLAARIVGEPGIAEILPWLAAVLPFNAIGATSVALCRRALRFRVLAACTIAGRLVGAATGIAMAATGFGVWSLVGQQVSAALITGIAILISASWRPRISFSLRALRDLWGFGAHVSASQIISTAAEQAVVLLVGSLLGATALGLFTIAWRMVQLIKALIASAVYQVAFSAFARLQHDRPAAARAFLQATRLSCLVGFPIGAGMAAVAFPGIPLLLGGNWTGSATLFALLALEMIPAFYLIFFTAGYRALGRAGWALGMAALTLAVIVAGVAASAQIGLEAVAIFWIAKSAIILPISVVLMSRLMRISVAALLQPALGPLLSAAVMAAAVQGTFALTEQLLPDPARLAIAIIAGVATYAGCARLFAPDHFRTALSTVRIMVARRSAEHPAPPGASPATPPLTTG